MSITPIAYSYDEAAKAVSVSSDYLRRECAAGRLGYRKIGRRVTIPHDELLRWYNAHDSGPQG